MSKSKPTTITGALCAAVLLGATALGGCASSTGGIEPAHVSSSKYSGYSCSRLRRESTRISNRAQTIAGKVDKRASNDAIAMGVALVVFWPAAFLVKGDGPEADEYAELLGERRAIEKAAKRKGCKIKFAPLKSSTQTAEAKKKNEPVRTNFAEQKN